MGQLEIKPNVGQLITSYFSISRDEIKRFNIDENELKEIVKNKITEGFFMELKKKEMVIKSEQREDAVITNTAELYVFTPEEMKGFVNDILLKKHWNGRD